MEGAIDEFKSVIQLSIALLLRTCSSKLKSKCGTNSSTKPPISPTRIQPAASGRIVMLFIRMS